MKIIKRNGSEAVFDISKIIAAITKANNVVKEDQRLTQAQIHSIADSVQKACESRSHAVGVEDIQDHKMHSEHYYMPQATAYLINKTKARGGRVIAVGTTSCRTIESVAQREGRFQESAGWTDIFLYPGCTFQGVDALITNFHLPESTLIMLVSALAGRENVLHAYNVAVQERYRFFSFGDAMFIH